MKWNDLFMYFEISYLNHVTVVDEQTNDDVISFQDLTLNSGQWFIRHIRFDDHNKYYILKQ